MVLFFDGYCRIFDVNVKGIVLGDGVGVVLLKWFNNAIVDGDEIYVIIRGFVINNDGFLKVGYIVLSVEG